MKLNVQILLCSIYFIFCINISHAQTIYQTNVNEGIIATDIVTGSSSQLVHPNIDLPSGIWVDTTTDTLYWTDSNAKTVMKAPEDSSLAGITAIANSVDQNLGKTIDLFVDLEDEKIYLSVQKDPSSSSNANTVIGVLSLNLKGQVLDTLITTEDGIERPGSLALDKANDILYVADETGGIFTIDLSNNKSISALSSEPGGIYGIALDPANSTLFALTEYDEVIRMNLDGSNRTTLVDSGFVAGKDIQIDLEGQKIYWTSIGYWFDEIKSKIQRANLDGSEVEDIQVYETDQYSPKGLFLDAENDAMYVTTYGSIKSLLKMNLDGTNTVELYNDGNSGTINPADMAYSESTNEFFWIRDGDTESGQPFFLMKTDADGSGTLNTIFREENEINSVEVDDVNSRLFWSLATGETRPAELYMGNLDGSNKQLLWETTSSGTARIYDITYVADRDELFWLVLGSDDVMGLYKMKMDDGTSTLITPTSTVADFVYVPHNDNLYMYGYYGITRISPDGTEQESISTDVEGSPGDISVKDDKLFIGTDKGVYSYDLSSKNTEMINSIMVDHSNSILFGPTVTITSTDENGYVSNSPEFIQLKQNYPNPFNPSTNIRFSISKTSNVSLKVFNMLGQEVATVFEGRKSQGLHNVKFDAAHLASGVYLYRLEAGGFNQTKKLTLIK